jgi:(E)-4-hydroxy-3-methylbut-2-enyl-diphosphate synthase
MSLRPWRDITRRQSRQIMVGNVPVGGDAPVTVQTMTNTPTSDPVATIDQIRRCEEAGVDIIRVSCPDVESTAALKQIVRASRVPIVADIHFHYKRALEAADAGAACLRINPGNIGSAERVREVVNAAKANGSASASMAVLSEKTCSKNMASPVPRRWSNPRSTISSCSRTTTSTNSRSR